MRKESDLLYTIFEHYLFNAMVENETSDEFIANVVREYLRRLGQTCSIPRGYVDTIETDLREEVLEMFRKKTYGHYSLAEFRKAHTEKPSTTLPPQMLQPDQVLTRRQRRLS